MIPPRARNPTRHQIRFIVTCLVIAAPLLETTDLAAQKRRKGFILNLGLGPAVTNVKGVGPFGSGEGDTRLALGTDFIIGHAATDQIMIYYSNDAAFFNEPGVAGFTEDRFIGSGLSGVGVSYFAKPQSPSYYVNGALGFAAWNELSDDGDVDSMTGLGLAVGGGYEFARHWLIDANIIVGRPREDGDFGINTTTLRVGLIWLAY